MHFSTTMKRGIVAAAVSAIILATSIHGSTVHARRQPRPPGMGPQTAFGRVTKVGMKHGGRLGQIAGVGAMAVGAITMNPFIFGGGFMAAASGTILNRGAKVWGQPPGGQGKAPKGNIFARVGKFGLRSTGRIAKLAGFGGMVLGAITLNPLLFGGGLAVAVGGRGVKKLGQRAPGTFFGGNQQQQMGMSGQQPMMDYDMDGMREGRMETPMMHAPMMQMGNGMGGGFGR